MPQSVVSGTSRRKVRTMKKRCPDVIGAGGLGVPRIAGRPSKGSPEGNPSGGGLPDVSGQLYSPPLLEERGTGGEVNKRRGLIETLSAEEWFTNLVV